jgi:ribonuclease R
MLVANVCAANHLKKNKMAALFRNHLGPDPDKLQQVRDFLGPLGLQLRGGQSPKPKDYAKVLIQAADRPDATLIQMVLLRSLTQAVYAANNEGHFGLAFDAYAHFTSPIRRYPDLLVHRAIKYCLTKQKPKRFAYTEEDMTRLGSHCSMTERRADDATRAAVDWLKCEFMLDKIGKIYPGKVSGVTAFGLFVTLDELFVDGLVHVTSLKDDYYSFDPKQHSLTGQRTGLQYKQGQALIVQVAGVNLDDRKIDFTMAPQESDNPSKAPPKKSNRNRKRRT